MRKTLICVIIGCMYSIVCWSKTDTLYFYRDSNQFNCGKDTAVYMIKQYKQKGKWMQENYAVTGNILNTINTFSDRACTILEGTTTAYSGDGTKIWSTEYDNGSPVTKTFYYKTGSKKAFMSYAYNINKSWDENSTELNKVIIEKDAKPAGFSWKGYLQDSINGDIPAVSKLPVGTYQVNAKFVVDTTGNLTEVKAYSDKCLECAKEVAMVISRSPRWEPAIKNNLRVPFETSEVINFDVLKDQAGRVGVGVAYQILRIFIRH